MTVPQNVVGTPFDEAGEMRALFRDMDWSETPLGPVEDWCATLRSTVRTALACPFPISLWCGDEFICIYNDGYRDVLGGKHPWAFGRPIREVWSEIWGRLEAMVEQIRARGAPIYAEDDPFLVERSPERDGGGTPGEPNAWFTYSLSPVRDEDGTLVALLNVVSETTGRVLAERQREEARARAERAESQLRDIFERAPAFLAVLRGPDYTFEYANQAYYELVGHRDLIGRPVFEALPEVRGQGFEELLDQVVETGEPFVGREMPLELTGNSPDEIERRYLDFVYYPLEEPEGTAPARVVAHGYEVTEHVRAREAAQRARAEAEEASRAKSRFLGTMSHELRTPLNAIFGYTELLQMEIPGALTDDQRNHLERVEASTEHLLMLVGDVLDLARVEAGEVEVERETVRMADTVADALSLVRPQASEGEIELGSACVDDDSPRYLGDPDRVRQILVNLLSNAVKYTPPGGNIRVTFGTARIPETDREIGAKPEMATSGNPHVESQAGSEAEPMTFVEITDTGIGIAPAEMERIFRPFAQVEASGGVSSAGSGLGLAIARRLAHLMEGKITARSEGVGKGSSFTLWLPR